MRFRSIDQFLSYYPEYSKGGIKNKFSEKSHLWNSILSPRTGIEQIDESALKYFLDATTQLSSGTSDWVRDIDDLMINYFKEKLPDSIFSDNRQMPKTGNPNTFAMNGKLFCSAYVWNLITYTQFMSMYEPHANGKLIDVVEVGAGYGCAAHLWLQSGLVNSYTIIDLPENLINSAYYLGENTQWSNVNLIEEHCGSLEPGSINLLTPSYIDCLNSVNFDLATNSDSLGEMPADTAKAYVQWIHDRLKGNGYFLSKNGHRRSRECIQKVSSYGYEKFNLVNLSPSVCCASAFDDFSHVVLLKKDDNVIDAQKINHIDTISNLFSIGLSQDLENLCRKIAGNNLTETDKRFLDASDRFFHGSHKTNRNGIISEQENNLEGEYLIIFNYLKAIQDSLLDNTENIEKLFNEYLRDGKSEIARLYSHMFLMANRIIEYDDDSIKNDNFSGVKLYIKEFESFEKSSPFVRWLKYSIRRDNIRKKISPHIKWKPSIIVRLKNIFFNLKESKVFSLRRGD